MRNIIGFLAILLIGIALYSISLPGYKSPSIKYGFHCPDSEPVIIDDLWQGCTNDTMDSADYEWMPDGSAAPLQPCKYCETDHDLQDN